MQCFLCVVSGALYIAVLTFCQFRLFYPLIVERISTSASIFGFYISAITCCLLTVLGAFVKFGGYTDALVDWTASCITATFVVFAYCNIFSVVPHPGFADGMLGIFKYYVVGIPVMATIIAFLLQLTIVWIRRKCKGKVGTPNVAIRSMLMLMVLTAAWLTMGILTRYVALRFSTVY